MTGPPGVQSAVTSSNTSLKTPIAIKLETTTRSGRHWSPTSPSKRQQYDPTSKSPEMKLTLQGEVFSFTADYQATFLKAGFPRARALRHQVGMWRNKLIRRVSAYESNKLAVNPECQSTKLISYKGQVIKAALPLHLSNIFWNSSSENRFGKMNHFMGFDYILLLLSSSLVLVAAPPPEENIIVTHVKRPWLDLNCLAPEDLPSDNDPPIQPLTGPEGFQSAITWSNTPSKTHIAINLDKTTPALQHWLPTSSSKRQRHDPAWKSPEMKLTLQDTILSFHSKIPGDRSEGGFHIGVSPFSAFHHWKKTAKTQGLGQSQLGASHMTGKSFDVYDWSFVRGDLGKQSSENAMQDVTLQDRETNRFFNFLNSCKKPQDRESFFWIPRDETQHIYRVFNCQRKAEFPFPDQGLMNTNSRHAKLWDTVLSLSETKVNLDQYKFESGEIIQQMKKSIESSHRDPTHPRVEFSVNKIMRRVDRVTKVAQFLITIYLSLFREHKEEKLTFELIETSVNFIRRLWFDIYKGGDEFFGRYPWAKVTSKLIQKNSKSIFNLRQGSQGADLYNIACNFFQAWVHDYENNILAVKPKYQSAKTLQELINSIIFFSNHGTILNALVKH
ncbi:hypothetical protein PSTG_13515 [Puccinia striiformis f. sp. tritici PST-78]|uniref:Uncharacterized protein n=1 Tax=Puccinia striiformis f. sp. tritici PST-78 TaxID=1165861 RepID=A0A0L0V1R4_9BASI|nr:hypothetical protein PSTG_13515 [Puccinia striiformis f. sp. tritici PST-78]